MKILFVRACSKISGAEVYNQNLLNQLNTFSDLTICFLTNFRPLAKSMKKLGVQALYTPWLMKEIGTKKDLIKSMVLAPLSIPILLTSIIQSQKGSTYDLICLQSMTEKLYLTGWLRILGYKIVWIEHGPLYKSQASRIIKSWYRILSNYVQKIIAVSQNTKNDLQKLGVSSSQIEVVYIGVDTKRLIPNRVKQANVMSIGFMGTITRQKGIEDFVMVANLLGNHDKHIIFKVIGDGPDADWMTSKIKALGIENRFDFTGFIHDSTSHMKNIDVFLFPTRHHEGISMALLEAQAMGKVIVTRDIGGNKEIIQDKINGYLYSDWNNEKVARDILSLLKNKKTMTSVGKAARENVLKRFSIQTQAKEFYRLFHTL
jgi:glycosyltransferase involved in cell wall biosynthesis